MRLLKNPLWPIMASWRFADGADGTDGADGADGGGGGKVSHWAGDDVALKTWADDKGFKDAASAAKAYKESSSKHWVGDDKDLQAYVDKKGLKDAGSVTKIYQDLEKKMGAMIGLPSEDANDVAYEKFAGKLRGRNVGEYAAALPEGLPEDVFDENLAGAIRQGAFDIGIPPKMYKQMEGLYWKAVGAQVKELDEKASEIKGEDEKTMRVKWGSDYDKNMELSGRAMEKTGVKDILKSVGLDTHPVIRMAFHQMSENLEEMSPPDSKGVSDGSGESEGAWYTDYPEVKRK